MKVSILKLKLQSLRRLKCDKKDFSLEKLSKDLEHGYYIISERDIGKLIIKLEWTRQDSISEKLILVRIMKKVF